MVNIAQYDLDTAEAMLKAGRYLYVAFVCQQAIEKLAKGLYVHTFDEEAKYTHNINLVLGDIEAITSSEKYKLYENHFDDLSGYYLVGRYDTYKQELSHKFDKAFAKATYDKTKEAFTWLQSLAKP